ncbi:MAG: DNA polymerase III subunit alpha [Candidatus Izemoplasmatales bacterium]|nr:DNA polymerase III subunit alpha [Candidatus Izemoplasmatales bacterium]
MMTFDLFIQTSYSFNGSLLDVDKLVSRAFEQGFTALGIADHKNLYGAIKFYQCCQAVGIKPIIGTVIDSRSKLDGKTTFLAIAKTTLGYHNLLKIVSYIQTENPVIPWDQLQTWKQDIIMIALSDRGDIYQAVLNNDLTMANDLYREYKQAFDYFYLGIDLSDFSVEMQVAPVYKTLGEAVIVNQVHYLDKDDLRAAKILTQIITSDKVENDSLFSSEEAIFNLKSPIELREAYSEYLEAVELTESLIAKIDVSIDFGKIQLPKYKVPGDYQAKDYLRALTTEGLKKRLASKGTQKIAVNVYQDRVKYELSVIEQMGYCDYFLIVWDFVLYAKKHGILVGPGRGSAAGSLVSYVLGIVDVDPLEHNLVFERFLNPERITMPDIDMDFPDDRRDEVIKYVADKYGKDHVVNIVAFGTFQGKSAIRDTAKVLGTNQTIIDEITGYISESENSIDEFKKMHPEKYRFLMDNPNTFDLLTISERIAGLPRHISTHAAGIVITDRDIREYAPIQNGLMGMYQTQWEMTDLEKIGLLKIDFLGIRNLTTIDRVLHLIETKTGDLINIYKIPTEDAKTFKLLQDVNTLGVFQLETDGMMNLARKMQIRTFDDIAVCVALFRPGPMENIPSYLRRRSGDEKVVFPHPDLEKILKETYGIIIYQEQILQIAHEFAGYSLGEADVLRRAVSKKKENVLIKEREKFVLKCKEKHYSEAIANEIYDYIVKFANYGFNKSHSVVYAMVAYWMAYLKANYPTYFMAVLLDSAIGSAKATADYIKECRKLKIKVLPPRINASQKHYALENGNLRFPYSGIRNIGNIVADRITEIKKDGPFSGFLDFVKRSSDLNSRVVESMILCGMFDEFPETKKTLINNLKQISNFIKLDGYASKETFVYLNEEEYDFDYLIEQEKSLLGVNLSYHPFSRYAETIERNGLLVVSDIIETTNGSIRIAGMINRVKIIKTKSGNEMAFVEIEDEFNTIEGTLFAREYANDSAILIKGNVVIVSGLLEKRENKHQIIVSNMQLLEK